jgi:rsbT co-antagonist protein RsbR
VPAGPRRWKHHNAREIPKAPARIAMNERTQPIEQLLGDQPEQVLKEWLEEARATDASHRREAQSLIDAVIAGVRAGGEPSAFNGTAWSSLRETLSSLSASRASLGESAAETSRFVLAMKKPFFARATKQFGSDTGKLVDLMWWMSTLVDQMAQLTVGTYQSAREDIIRRQQQELLELSTPVVKLWDGVLAVPMIGTLDSSRTQLVMETLLQGIVDEEAQLAIIDITGVPTVDTLVAQHLLKTVTAIRLMGANCIISGIRPQIAQTIVHLGIDLEGVTTKATLADALQLAMRQTGYLVTRATKS